MREIYDLRLFDDYVKKVINTDEGKLAPFVPIRRLKWNSADGRKVKFMSANRIARDSGAAGICPSWSVKRSYSESELSEARLFKMIVGTMFEPAEEECDTQYDEASSCFKCGSGARQTSPLFLRKSKIPKTKDISRTIAGELVVSRRFADLIKDYCVTGVTLSPVLLGSSSLVASDDWFQLIVENVGFDVVQPTLSGNNPFDYDDEGAYKCKCCGLLGLNILTEVFAGFLTTNETDFICSRQFVGVRRGLLRPVRVICVSKRLRELILSNGIQGVSFEVVYVEPIPKTTTDPNNQNFI